MKKTKRAARWNETNNINNNLAAKRSEERFRQVSEERAEDKRRMHHDMRKAKELQEHENKVQFTKAENYKHMFQAHVDEKAELARQQANGIQPLEYKLNRPKLE